MIVRYQHPYAAFRQFDREFERLVRLGFGRGAVQYSLRADVYTEGEDLVVRAAVPGVSAEDVTVELEGRRLSITAERKARESAEGDRYLVRGLSAGSFRREFTLPEGTTAEQLTAGVADGILTVRVAGAVKPAPTAQRIPVAGAPVEIEAEATDAETETE
ncbi:MAG: Hsp20/alpha crystallin family protein [Glycomyces artemisiae]|uniref:HSP20 family protein n=1 Tax=Glycomyces artemisiae TaxID=1076443 RepID=A0A2T0UWW0_9ACTN|nr:Hsp20/alpha crystallin family protein [Glycomyces artemisiae]NUQ90562.1 Hsp20/alpha crystallin family protein [Glycomyces artemisiae]PRY62413.1 HSP20 family protein [Glycomyces artemisiae]